MRTFTKITLLTTITFAFAFTSDQAEIYYQKGLKNLYGHQYIQAIGDFTNAISLKRDFGDAYFQRAKSKDLLGKQAGFFSTDLCYDLISAIKYGNDSATDMLREKSTVQCHSIKSMQHEPDLVFCADFSSSVLSSMPTGSDQLHFISYLNLFDNRFEEFPSEVLGYKYLLHLDVSSNSLTTLPEDINKMSWLTELNVNKNRIASLPTTLFQLKELKQLYLRSNELTTISAQVSHLKDLEELDLGLNDIKTLPEEIKQLTNLKKLILVGNPMSEAYVKQLQKEMPNTKIFFHQ
ncbi:MAG: leucine-rich repeat domain-containing protein [Flammeovirgaceae bacterium]